MTDASPTNIIQPRNQDSMNTLVRAIRLSEGQFSLIFLQCNYARVRARIAHQLLSHYPLALRELVLPADTATLFTAIKTTLGEEQPAAVMVFGLESLQDLNTVLNSTNQVREEFPKHFHRPLMLWINDSILRQLIRVAPDLESWATTIPFEISTEELTDLIQQAADEIFTQLLNSHETQFLDDTAVNLAAASPRRAELQSACRELQDRQAIASPALAANVEFILGRVADNSAEASRRHYEQSLALWRQANQPERSGHLLFYLGLWWMNYAAQHLGKRQPALQQAEAYFRQAIELFEQIDRPDLAARFINFWAEALQRQKQWMALERVANKALELHQTYSDQFRLARAHGFLAEAALARLAWRQAQQSAQTALYLMEQAEVALKTTSPDEDTYLDLQHSFHQGWYLFSLAKAQHQLGESQAAIETLTAAQLRTKPCYDPELYIAILGALQACYFQQRDYLNAFEIKRSQQKIESQFGLRAFIGAARLQTKQAVANPALPTHEPQVTAALEIAASGRQQDVNRLLERMGRPDFKLTIIHGQSGVGKSSILQAGLIPALKQKTFESREVLPVLQRVYANWEKKLGRQLAAAYTPIHSRDSNPLILATASDILDQLRRNSSENLLTVLIFDQFEEFFFSRPTLAEQLSFYNFASQCLNIPYVKVILSIREDYLHYLLICNRLSDLEVINNNILDKSILYYLGNFSKEDARSVLQSLSEQAQLAWKPYLIEQLVVDLADEFDQVRPIELQLLGAQLQAEGISTLTQYLAQGEKPKEVIVERYLEEVVKDCGPENSRVAEQILYLLTDKEGVRPQKTRAELLEAESLAAEFQKIDLVLGIFIRSGLVMWLPAAPADRYQLVHDYLVSLVRQKYGKKIVEELSNLRKKVQEQAEQEKKKLRRISLIGLLGALLFAILTDRFQLALQVIEVSKAEIERSKSILELELEGPESIQKFNFSQTNGLLSAIKSAGELRDRFSAPYPAASPVLALQKIVYGIHEKNWLNSEQKGVLWVSFSPDGELFATAGADGTVKLWDLSGQVKVEFSGHQDLVWSVSFSPDNRFIATASADGSVQIWDLSGQRLARWTAHPSGVASVSFSPDSQFLATAGVAGKAQLWDLSGQPIAQWQAHLSGKLDGTGATGISFSPDGQSLATIGNDSLVRLWDLSGQQLAEFTGHQGSVLSLSWSPDGQHVVTAGEDSTVRLWSLAGEQLFELSGHHQGDVASVRFSPDGRRLASAGADGVVRLWELIGPKRVQALAQLNGHPKYVWSVDFSPDGQYLVTGDINGVVRLWDLSRREYARWRGHGNIAWSVNFSPDGQTLVTSGGDSKAQLWDMSGESPAGWNPTPPKLAEFQHQKGDIYWVSMSPNGQLLATAGEDGGISLWRRSGEKILELVGRQSLAPDSSRTVAVNHVGFSPDGNRFVTASGDGVVTLWTLSGRKIAELKGHEDSVFSTSFSPDGKYLATASDDGSARLWDLDMRRQAAELSGHEGGVLWVNFSPDGKQLVTAGRDGVARLWDITDELAAELVEEFNGHRLRVSWAGFSPDGRRIATAGRDGNVILWTKSGQQIAQFEGHQGGAFSVSFSPDGQLIAAAEGSGAIKLWRLEDLDALINRGCDWLSDYFVSHPEARPDMATVCSNDNER